MKKYILLGILIGLAFLVSGSDVYAYSLGGIGICNCGDGTTLLGGSATDTCVDCSAALNDNVNCANQVNYVGTVAITNYAGTCINNPANFNNKIFDCQGHTIDGDDSGTDYGIYLYGKSGNTIKNCVITDFNYGIFLYYSSKNILTNDTENSNTNLGILLGYSSNNNITNNMVNNNVNYGINLYSSSNNNLTNNTANNDGTYGIIVQVSSNYNNLINNMVSNSYYGIYSYSSSYNNLTNNTAKGNDDGIILYTSSNYNILTNNTANNNSYGIYLSYSSNNIIANNTANNNTNLGILLGYSSNNNITNNTANNNTDYGIDLYSSSNNNLTNNTANNNNYGISILESSNYNTLTNNTAKDNNYGISLYSSSNNTITNNTLCLNQIFDIHSIKSNNGGDNNTCHTTFGWNDEGTTNCTNFCPFCTDGTPLGECSNQTNGGMGRPYQCQNGLVPNCTVCGCEPGHDCDPVFYGDNNCHPSCNMTTGEKAPEGQCFATQPYFCVNATTNQIIENCSECGCQQTYTCQADGSCEGIIHNCAGFAFVCPSAGYQDQIIGDSFNCQCGWKNGNILKYDFTNAPQCWYNISCNPGATVQCYHAEGIPLWAIITAGVGGFGAVYAFYYYKKRKRRK